MDALTSNGGQPPLTMEEISHLLDGEGKPEDTLANIVTLVGNRLESDVCSVYLYEPEGPSLVLAATVGLKQDCIGRLRMRLDEGLAGLVAEQLRPVAVEDADTHPRFKYFPEAGEDAYESFLGVPLIEGGALQGVLVLQTIEARQFSTGQIRRLVDAAGQLGAVVSQVRRWG
ncbi:MAG: GAF domain-containing protein [Planctomycetales bacterium]|nr:GAF domain-containing protein [Planctomycetales bacterium]NIM09395.1 GAF domain-containing protein [Planctomycetales bacterium]NIN08864.1 GAF domain-containing protein [Planctomycetales bacterium]NIN78739.1 GAF domain-containing protein [Planctomycetales bacterium]NIO35913.1 GAF domain-containing protein [Planctomycetales bacterium]